MALQKVNSKQIKPGAVSNSHIASNAAIDESKLNIDWNAHTGGHIHADESFVVDNPAGITEYALRNLNIKDTDFISVWINAGRQFPEYHFTKTVVNNRITTIVFDGVIELGDIIYIEYAIYN